MVRELLPRHALQSAGSGAQSGDNQMARYGIVGTVVLIVLVVIVLRFLGVI